MPGDRRHAVQYLPGNAAVRRRVTIGQINA
jgi:hypothetical protein